jgi:hypothetical protein
MVDYKAHWDRQRCVVRRSFMYYLILLSITLVRYLNYSENAQLDAKNISGEYVSPPEVVSLSFDRSGLCYR